MSTMRQRTRRAKRLRATGRVFFVTDQDRKNCPSLGRQMFYKQRYFR